LASLHRRPVRERVARFPGSVGLGIVRTEKPTKRSLEHNRGWAGVIADLKVVYGLDGLSIDGQAISA
jgi:hypothetical protein